ncbi:MAG TPA: hypothetical protein VFT88_03730 [Acidobacteriaceae bacterium]|jgi:hypothetical protein|nr:hypothetical protein [Acidobacteriaceae bacterium]
MRTSLNIDADAYDFASYYASARGITLGAAVSELIRRAEQASEPRSTSPSLRVNELGLLVKARTGKTITPEMVKESSEDDLD